MELDELHVFHRDARAVRHRDAVAGVCDRVRGVIEHLSHPAGRENDTVLGAKAADLAALNVVGDDAVAGPVGRVVLVVGDGEFHHVPLVVYRDPAFDHLLVHRVEHLVAGLRAGVRGPGKESPPNGRWETRPSSAGEGHSPVFEPDLFRTLPTEGLDRRRVTEVVGPLHRVVCVVLP